MSSKRWEQAIPGPCKVNLRQSSWLTPSAPPYVHHQRGPQVHDRASQSKDGFSTHVPIDMEQLPEPTQNPGTNPTPSPESPSDASSIYFEGPQLDYKGVIPSTPTRSFFSSPYPVVGTPTGSPTSAPIETHLSSRFSGPAGRAWELPPCLDDYWFKGRINFHTRGNVPDSKSSGSCSVSSDEETNITPPDSDNETKMTPPRRRKLVEQVNIMLRGKEKGTSGVPIVLGTKQYIKGIKKNYREDGAAKVRHRTILVRELWALVCVYILSACHQHYNTHVSMIGVSEPRIYST